MLSRVVTAGCLALRVGLGPVLAQSPAAQMTTLPLNDLSAFRSVSGKNWQVASDVTADATKKNALTAKKGTGVLVNLPNDRNKTNLQTTLEHGDIDLELDYMMAKESNSGIYLQGRYEIQLLDSWGVKGARIGDNGSIYQRWDESRPEGQKGYEGHAARQNASKAPGLWQHLRIWFQAPRFDGAGKKIENARVIRIELNGVTIHENVDLTGPTRGPLADNEVARGPLLIQGDHGPVAFRNIRYTAYDQPRPELTNLTYAVFPGQFTKEPEFGQTPPEAQGPITGLNTGGIRNTNNFLVRYTGTLDVKEAGEYTFSLNGAGGFTSLKINSKPVVAWGSLGRQSVAKVTLPAGQLPFELIYSKVASRASTALGLSIQGAGLREFFLGDKSLEGGGFSDRGPILVDAPANTILRSFMDVPNENGQGRRTRVTHAISVGSPEQLHYTYDLDNGALVQVWRGQFLDATPMWNSRGDGSSRPTGMVQRFGVPRMMLGKLASAQASWAKDTVNSGFRPKGYSLDESKRPTFMYSVLGTEVQDVIRILDNGQGVRRELTVAKPANDLYAFLADGKSIEALPNGTYLVDGKSYYIQLTETGGAKPVVRSAGGRQELIIPVRGNKLSYSILF
ncbi:family 16 glycoside hydrolase [Larkinella insperata]|uniref:Family 16 glycoside hydrolase n=1 Tax=Larkinella insperata TaxID=332158 RepID=A0ABW3QCQ8_9BACT